MIKVRICLSIFIKPYLLFLSPKENLLINILMCNYFTPYKDLFSFSSRFSFPPFTRFFSLTQIWLSIFLIVPFIFSQNFLLKICRSRKVFELRLKNHSMPIIILSVMASTSFAILLPYFTRDFTSTSSVYFLLPHVSIKDYVFMLLLMLIMIIGFNLLF